jgi:hypothetical protein
VKCAHCRKGKPCEFHLAREAAKRYVERDSAPTEELRPSEPEEPEPENLAGRDTGYVYGVGWVVPRRILR